MKLSIIVPTYKGKHLLERFLPHMEKQLKSIEHEMIVVDNASEDGTKEYVQKEFPQVTYIDLPRNTGFTGGVNAGVKAAKAPLLLIINNDCLIEKNDLIEMMDFLKKEDLDATQPVICTPKGKIENVGFVLDKSVGRALPVLSPEDPYISPAYMKWNSKERYFYGITAACLLIKKNVFESVGMFDEKFHSYLEDIDISIHLSKKSYSYFPTLSAKAVHAHLSTSSKMGSYKEQRDLLNWYQIIVKHYSLRDLMLYFPTLYIERLRNMNGLLKKMIK